MPPIMEIPLDLPEIRILRTELSERESVITVQSTREWAICARCGGETRQFHSYGRLLRLRHLPKLKQADDLREQLTAIVEADHDKTSATAAIKRWMKRVSSSGLSCFDRFLVTLGKWIDEITNYFTHRLTSGFVEGFNSKVKVLKRRCYGISNLKHFFRRLYLDLEGYQLLGL
jgi:Transposase